MKMSKTEEKLGVRIGNKYYNYSSAPILCRDSKTGRDLHRDNAGKYFLHTPNTTGVKSITSLTLDEAKQIVARDGTAEQYQKLFMAPLGTQKSIRLEGQDAVCLEFLCNVYGMSGNELIRRLIRAEYRRQKKSSYDKTRYDKSKLSDMNKPLTADE